MHCPRHHRAIAIASWIVLGSVQARAGTIGLYAEPAGTGCSVNIPQGQAATIYAIGKSSSADFGGFVNTGEFRVVGLPATWTAIATPVPSLFLAIGDPLGNGVTFAWSQLQTGVIPLFTIHILANTSVNDVELSVVKHVTPSPPFGFPTTCPRFHYPCGDPCDSSRTCVSTRTDNRRNMNFRPT